MNGEPLTPEHGGPLRLLLPGFAGLRSLNWLTRIEVRNYPSDAPIQANDYKVFPADVARDDADRNVGLTIENMPINAAICSPSDGARVSAGCCTIQSYAIASGHPISRVDVSTDGGIDWRQADIVARPDAPCS